MNYVDGNVDTEYIERSRALWSDYLNLIKRTRYTSGRKEARALYLEGVWALKIEMIAKYPAHPFAWLDHLEPETIVKLKGFANRQRNFVRSFITPEALGVDPEANKDAMAEARKLANGYGGIK